MRWTSPPGTLVTVLLGTIEGPHLVALVTLEPGRRWPTETHPDHEELLVCLAGRFSLVTESHRRGLEREGPWFRSFAVRKGVEHTVINDSATENAQYLSILRREGA